MLTCMCISSKCCVRFLSLHRCAVIASSGVDIPESGGMTSGLWSDVCVRGCGKLLGQWGRVCGVWSDVCVRGCGKLLGQRGRVSVLKRMCMSMH